MDRRKLTGREGEAEAARYLKRRGYAVVAMNWACRLGEIDVIAQKGDTLVFVEVKTRKNADFAQAREFVTPAKQRRILAAASLYLQEHPTQAQPRFDVIEVYTGGEAPAVSYIENAF